MPTGVYAVTAEISVSFSDPGTATCYLGDNTGKQLGLAGFVATANVNPETTTIAITEVDTLANSDFIEIYCSGTGAATDTIRGSIVAVHLDSAH
ncbi:MAG: hypothetical protein ACYDGR_11680 [Candidatus Dormibacteria bacterium]